MAKKKRKSNKSSAKGGGFERLMCRAWSKWWTNERRDDIFWRTSGSGSRATTRGKKGIEDKWNHGDMKPDDPEGFMLCTHWCFEFKNYKKYDIKGVLHRVNEHHDWLKWWAKIVDEAAAINRAPILVTKQNAGVPIIWFHERTWFQLQQIVDLPSEVPMIRLCITERDVKIKLKRKKSKKKPKPKPKTIHLKNHEVFGVPLDAWFNYTDPEAWDDLFEEHP